MGLNRNLRGKAAGVRTHALVSLGAAAAALAAARSGDATRVMQGIITGIGFLGAGVILHPRTGGAPPAAAPAAAAPAPAGPAKRVREVRGLTTAATVWVAAVLGMAAGLGYWSLTLLAAALTLAVLLGGGAVEDVLRRRFRRIARRRRAARRAARRPAP